MFDWFTGTVDATTSLIVWALIFFTVVQVGTIVGVAVKTYYSLKVIRQISQVLDAGIKALQRYKRQ